MAGNRSFKDYIARRFDNQIFNAIAAYADSFGREDFDQLGLQIYRLHQIGDFELSETTVLHTAIYDLPEMHIGFDIRVEAYFEVHEGDYHYDETEYAKQWFVLKCTGDLDKNLDDFAIHDIEIYDSSCPTTIRRSGKRSKPITSATSRWSLPSRCGLPNTPCRIFFGTSSASTRR